MWQDILNSWVATLGQDFLDDLRVHQFGQVLVNLYSMSICIQPICDKSKRTRSMRFCALASSVFASTILNGGVIEMPIERGRLEQRRRDDLNLIGRNEGNKAGQKQLKWISRNSERLGSRTRRKIDSRSPPPFTKACRFFLPSIRALRSRRYDSIPVDRSAFPFGLSAFRG